MHRTPPRLMVESDRDIRRLERLASEGDRTAKIKLAMARRRSGDTIFQAGLWDVIPPNQVKMSFRRWQRQHRTMAHTLGPRSGLRGASPAFGVFYESLRELWHDLELSRDVKTLTIFGFKHVETGEEVYLRGWAPGRVLGLQTRRTETPEVQAITARIDELLDDALSTAHKNGLVFVYSDDPFVNIENLEAAVENSATVVSTDRQPWWTDADTVLLARIGPGNRHEELANDIHHWFSVEQHIGEPQKTWVTDHNGQPMARSDGW